MTDICAHRVDDVFGRDARQFSTSEKGVGLKDCHVLYMSGHGDFRVQNHIRARSRPSLGLGQGYGG